jgi:hypothetical protein
MLHFTVTRLRAGRSRNCGSIPEKGKIFVFSKTPQTSYGAHSASYIIVTAEKIPGDISAVELKWPLQG